MRIDEIAVFIRVLEAGSFTAAAKLLGMPATTVSAKVAALEKRLGVQLIARTTRSLRATPAGELYLERSRTALQEIEQVEAELSPDAEVPQGTLRITAPVASGRGVLPELVAAYREAFSAVRVELRITDREIDMVAEGIDLAIRVGPLKDSSMIARKLVESYSGFFASRAYLERHGTPESLDDLAHHQVVGFSRDGSLTNRMRYRGEPVSVTLEAPVVSDDFGVNQRFIGMGLGIGYLPGELAGRGKDAFVRVLPDYSSLRTALYFAYPRQRFVPARVRSFMAFAIEHAERFWPG